MKNQYIFERLTKSELPAGLDEAALFFAMHKLTLESTRTTPINDIADLATMLRDERYYVANKVVAHKGKTVVFKGKVVLAEKSYLLSFLRQAMAEDDLRPLFISPCFKVEPKQVFFISEDECHVYIADSR